MKCRMTFPRDLNQWMRQILPDCYFSQEMGIPYGLELPRDCYLVYEGHKDLLMQCTMPPLGSNGVKWVKSTKNWQRVI
jgi:hypothetical protein